ncbi:MAG: hypothetical protein AB8E82_17760 [Aureispira sp.]
MNHTLHRPFHSREILGLKLLVICLFLGRAYQGIFFDLPLRTFFWDEALLEGVVTWLTGDSWQNYVTNKSMNTDKMINTIGWSVGVFWALCGALVLLFEKKRSWLRYIFYIATLSLICLALLYWKEKFKAFGQLFEYASQVSAPLILVYAVWNGSNSPKFRLVLKLVVATTFVCHGLYAIGYYPQPGIWIQWCMDTFYFPTDESAQLFLKVMGVLDFAAAALLFFRPTFNLAIGYCILWGCMTATARVWCNFYWEFPLDSLHQWTYQMLLRLIHGGLPLLLWYWSRE